MFGLFKKKTFNKDHFSKIVNDLVDKMDSTQEIIIASIHSQLEEILNNWKFDLENLNPEVIDALYGYQITCLVGFCVEEKLIKREDLLIFRKEILKTIKKKSIMNTISNTKLIEDYNQRYLDCWGDIPCLNKKFYEDIMKIYKVPNDKDKIHEIIGFLEDTSVSFALQTQTNTANVFGDKVLQKKLAKRFQKYLEEESYVSKHKK